MPAVQDKTIALGHPSYVWLSGQDRRLHLVLKYVPLQGRKVLDVGCGLGMYMNQFRRFTPEVYGVDIDAEKVDVASKSLPNVYVSPAEALPFDDGKFDVVFLHEVIEHVDDDRKAIQEAYRVLGNGGSLVIYAPNRLYFFETHGFYLGKRYVFKLLPFVNYLPNFMRRFFVPHVRAYLGGDLKKLFEGLAIETVVHTYVYPGFDAIAMKSPWLAKVLRRVLYFAENTPIRVFGLSHFLVVKKTMRSDGDS
ncbi:MAG: class I SAM-dependent methyltransferase [Dehalococcoidia bacterium]|nr:class I SAM-dependent methyltransferase [Dehalococcoidia bacterium]